MREGGSYAAPLPAPQPQYKALAQKLPGTRRLGFLYVCPSQSCGQAPTVLHNSTFVRSTSWYASSKSDDFKDVAKISPTSWVD